VLFGIFWIRPLLLNSWQISKTIFKLFLRCRVSWNNKIRIIFFKVLAWEPIVDLITHSYSRRHNLEFENQHPQAYPSSQIKMWDKLVHGVPVFWSDKQTLGHPNIYVLKSILELVLLALIIVHHYVLVLMELDPHVLMVQCQGKQYNIRKLHNVPYY